MKTPMIFCLICLVCAGGCAGRMVGAGTLSPMPATASREDSFAAQVAAQPEGSIQDFVESPFGPATVNAGPFYSSALGHKCRSARVTAGAESHRFAVCREENGAWRFIPTIFESMPR